MLTSAEKRFIKYWEEQRVGGKVKYYLLYIIVGTFMAVLGLFFLYSVFISPAFRWRFGVIAILVAAPVLVTLITVMTWSRNEKKFKEIIRREMREGEREENSGI